jgi:hypothetical protein
MPPFSAEMEIEIGDLIATKDWLFSENTQKSSSNTPKTQRTQRVQQSTSPITVKLVLTKRLFKFEFSKVEDSPLKIRKPNKKSLNTQNGVFSAGLASPPKAIQIADIQKAIQEALNPLIAEIQHLKIEIISLKKENSEFSSQMTRKQTEILKKNENTVKATPSSAPSTSNIAEKAIQRTVKETYAKIAKINSLMTK